MGEKLYSIFSYRFELNIWKYLFDRNARSMVVELRSHSDMSVQFAICDIATSKVELIPFEKGDWWTSIEDYDGKNIYFKQYESDANPDVKTIIQYHIGPDEITYHSSEKIIEASQNEYLRPSLYPSNNQHYPLLSEFVLNTVNSEVNKAGIEYLDHNEMVYVSYYTGNPKMANFLLVVDSNRDILLHECMDNNLEGIGQDTFTITDNKLIFVKEKKELNIYQINENA